MARPPRSRLLRALVAITALAHAPFLLAAHEALARLGASSPWALASVLTTGLVAALPSRAARVLEDRPRSRWSVLVLDAPYHAHWSATLMATPVVIVGGVGAAALDLARGRAPGWPPSLALLAYGAALAVCLWGVFVRRRWVRVREIDVRLAGLPRAFDGYRVAQLSDLHIGAFAPRAWGERWAALANRAAPDLVVVTGDLVTSGTAFHHDIAAVIGRLRAPDGVVVSMGNHDYFGEGEPLVSLLRATGALVLRNEGVRIARPGGALHVAALDDTWTRRADLLRALSGVREGEYPVLLAHDPDVFDDAAAAGARLVLAGHTHGGQLAVPFFARRWSLARLTHPRWLGLYRAGDAVLHVHPGLGTTGPPIRVGVAPEVTVLRLRAA